MQPTELKLEDLAGGSMQEQVQQSLEEIISNMQDPNTPWKNKRELVIKLSFTQNENRNDATCAISVTKKLAQVKPIETKFSIGKDIRDGSVYMEEYGPQIKGQMNLNDYQTQQVVGTDVVDTDTGEVVGKVTPFVKEA